jgi:hypothetical protein
VSEHHYLCMARTSFCVRPTSLPYAVPNQGSSSVALARHSSLWQLRNTRHESMERRP